MSVNPATSIQLMSLVKAFVVSWTDSTTSGATHTVYRSKGACGAYVPIASGISASYTDFNIVNGEVYAYYVVANVGNVESPATPVVSATFVGEVDPYSATLTSEDAYVERRGAVTVYAGVIAAGVGEYQHLQRLRGLATLCGK